MMVPTRQMIISERDYFRSGRYKEIAHLPHSSEKLLLLHVEKLF